VVVKRNILLVDDDQIFNFINRKTLEGIDVINDVRTALNGQQALDLIHDHYHGTGALPEVIFLDLNMPLMNGFQFLEVFKNLNVPGIKKVKIVIVTSSENPQDIQQAKSLGIEHYLTKPVSEDDLLEIFQEI
jgi:CheY-like chemotaxis protein